MKVLLGAALIAAMVAPAPLDAKSSTPFSFAANARKHGVRQTKSGLQYRIIKPGRGASPIGDQSAVVMYIGRFPDGKTFDASKQPVSLSLTRLIPGFREGLALMRKGATYRFWIPPALGYGARDVRDDDGTVAIPANSILMFDVTLVDILPLQSDEVPVPTPGGR